MTVYAITDTKKGRTGIAPTCVQVGSGAAGAVGAAGAAFIVTPALDVFYAY